MKHFNTLLVLIISLISLTYLFSTELYASVVRQNDLQSGDVLLIPVSCMVCSAIEYETDSDYAHSAVVLGKKEGEKLEVN